MTASILIIDDDAAFRRLLEMRLRAFFPDASITQKISLTEARSFLSANPPAFDLVILDQHLTDGEGVELLTEGWFQDLAVLSVSSDDNPHIPGASIKAGAAYFLNKSRVSEPLFRPLVEGILDRNRLQKELDRVRLEAVKVDTIKTLVSTLRHEINNPLGAVLGGAYLMRNLPSATPEQKEAAALVESSGKRIKHVLDELCSAIEIQSVQKAAHSVFHIPGDKPWDDEAK